MPGAATLADALEPLRADRPRGAVLLDVDGTLAPIVRHADDAHVPEATRGLLIDISRAYGMVACVSGRRATAARQVVSLGTITYVGNHGAELLPGGTTEPHTDPELQRWVAPVTEFAARALTRERHRLRVRSEDKGPIAAFHWRGAPDELAAEAAVNEIAQEATDAGLQPHWGRKVLEVRPPVAIDKGIGVRNLLEGTAIQAALYVGDDNTDLDAFRGLRAMVSEGRLERSVCVGVRSEETPPGIAEESDLLVDGPAGVRGVLQALLG